MSTRCRRATNNELTKFARHFQIEPFANEERAPATVMAAVLVMVMAVMVALAVMVLVLG